MVRRVAATEAKQRSARVAEMGKHGLAAPRRPRGSRAPVVRMPPQYSSREVELLLEALWNMFTESQAKRLVVAVPWDDAEEPQQILLADLAATLESWLG
jgi:hypothetical protein